MSTAGKVLSVLVLLATLGWIVLGAGVAQLNRNGNAALAKLQADLKNAEDGLHQAQVDLVKLKDDTSRFQENMDTQLAVLRAKTTGVEAAGSRLKGILADMQGQLSTVEATVAAAQHDLEMRKQEKQSETQQLADARAEVLRLRGVDAEMTDRLASLRQEFKKTYEENASKVSASR
jgi:chromosome segregation ATPase